MRLRILKTRYLQRECYGILRNPSRISSKNGSPHEYYFAKPRSEMSETGVSPSPLLFSRNSENRHDVGSAFRVATIPLLMLLAQTEPAPEPMPGQVARLSQGEIDALRSKLISLWNPPPAVSANPDQYDVTIRIRLTRDHRLASPPIVLTNGQDVIRGHPRQRRARRDPSPTLRHAVAVHLRSMEGNVHQVQATRKNGIQP